MKKRDKKLALSKETVRDLTVSEAKLREILGGEGEELDATCIPGGTTHWPNLC